MKTIYCFIIIIASIAKINADLHLVFIALVALTFFLFAKDYKNEWIHLTYYGVANIITTIRLLLILTMAFGFNLATHDLLYLPILIIPLLDLLDGWIARKRNEVSHFGMLYDMEVDALFVLVASLLIFEKHPLLWIVLIPAYLRYIYKVSIDYLDRKQLFVESKQQYASIIAGNYFVALIVFFYLQNDFSVIYISISSILILLSFAKSYLDFFKWRYAQ